MALDFGGLMGNAPISPVTAGNQGMAMRFAMQDRELAQANAEEDRQMKIDEVNRQVAEQQRKADVLQRAIAGDPIARAEYVASHAKNSNEASFAMDESKKPQREEAVKLAYTEQALSRSNPEAHLKALQDRIELLSNVQAPTPEQQQELAVKRTMMMLPTEQRALMADSVLASFAGDAGLKFMESQRAQNLQPFKVAEARGQAQKAGAEGEFAPQLLQADIDEKKANTQLKVAEAALKRLESSGYMTPEQQLRANKLRLEIGELEGKRTQIVADKQNAFDSASADFDSTLDTLYTLKNHKGMKSALGPVDSRFPSFGDEVIDFEKQLEKLQSQQFLTAVAKVGSMAGLTEVEGKKLQNAIGALDIKMQPETFNREVNKVVKKIEEMKALTAKKYGQKAPDKNQVSSRGQGFDLIKKSYPDASDEQINAYLAQQGL